MTAKDRQRRYRERHREERNAKARARYRLNKDKEFLRHRIYRANNLDKLKAKDRIRDANPVRRSRKAELERTEKRKHTRRLWKQNNLNAFKAYQTSYEASYREKRRKFHHEKQANDPQYRLRKALRSSLKNAIKYSWRGGSAIANLGCSIDELRRYLESLWQDGMSWNNFGRLSADRCTWQIDHVMPLSSFDLTDSKQVAAACHWTNLAPLWAIDNRRKWNKIVSREEVSNASL